MVLELLGQSPPTDHNLDGISMLDVLRGGVPRSPLLFNLEHDPGEQWDRAEREPRRIAAKQALIAA